MREISACLWFCTHLLCTLFIKVYFPIDLWALCTSIQATCGKESWHHCTTVPGFFFCNAIFTMHMCISIISKGKRSELKPVANCMCANTKIIEFLQVNLSDGRSRIQRITNSMNHNKRTGDSYLSLTLLNKIKRAMKNNALWLLLFLSLFLHLFRYTFL